MVLVKNLNFFLYFYFWQNKQKKMLGNIEGRKKAFLDYKNKDLKVEKLGFSKEV